MKMLALVLCCLMLAGCGGASDTTEAKKDEEKVFDPLIQSVDKANAVEDTVLQQKKDLDEAMRRMEDGDDDADQNP
jgi:hypothetical protein